MGEFNPSKPPKLTIEHAGLGDIPDSSGLHDVPDDEFLDGLVLGHAAGAVGAADGLHVPTALLGTPVVPPLLGLKKAGIPPQKRWVWSCRILP